MSYYDDVVEHETGGYNNIDHVKKIFANSEKLLNVQSATYWVDVLYLLRTNLSTSELVIAAYAHRFPNLKEPFRPLFEFCRLISHGDVNGIMHDSEYVVDLHTIADCPLGEGLSVEEIETFNQILDLHYFVAEQAQRVLLPVKDSHFQVEHLITNYQQLTTWKQVD